MKLYSPLYLIEAYLIFTLLLLEMGPLTFTLHNEYEFWLLIVLYHVSFCIGYFISIRSKSNCRPNICHMSLCDIRKRYMFLLVLVLYTWLIVARNITHGPSYIPYDLFDKLAQGIFNPAVNYYSNKSGGDLYLFHGNKVMTGSILFTYFFYYCFPCFVVFFWEKITLCQRVCSIVIIFLCLLLGIVSGTNAPIFHVLIPLLGGGIIKKWGRLYNCQTQTRVDSVKNFSLKILLAVMLLAGVLYFVHNIDTRLAGDPISYYKEKTVDVAVNDMYEDFLDTDAYSSLIKGISSIQWYVCQGYYGMSLAIDKDFTSTYGVGHSLFLLSSLDNMFNINLVDKTYQQKINNIWSSTINWHSFYSQMANDFGFYGVCIIMMFLGYVTAKVWKDILFYNNLFAKLFMVVLMPVYIFMPMNNQMGNNYGTFFAFWILLFLWILTRKYVLSFGNKVRI